MPSKLLVPDVNWLVARVRDLEQENADLVKDYDARLASCVARVRKLETALTDAEQILRHVFDTGWCTGKTIYDARDVMRRALKED